MHDIALIGAGRIGLIHADNVLRDPRLQLKYVVDPFPAAAQAVSQSTGAQAVSLDEALADPEVKGVIVASATDTHIEYSVRAVQAGKAVFCEKPMDLDLGRARAAADVLDAPGARIFLGFNRRFDPNFARLRSRLISGEMGPLETLHIISHDPGPPPIEYVKVSGGLFKDMAIHDFDMARWLLGEEPVEVFASTSCLVDPAIGEAGDFDTAKTMLRTASGKLCVISNSRRSGYGYDQRVEAFCSKGMIRAGNVNESTVEVWTEAGPAGDAFQNFFLARYADAYREEMTHFADIVEGAPASVDYNDGVAALYLAEAAAESAKLGQPVPLKF